MSKEILLGPLLGNNRSKLIKRCSEFVSEGNSEKFLYLAASHPLLELVTEQILDGSKNPGVWGELPVYLFRGFVRRILTTAVDEVTGQRLTPRIPIDREELPLKRSLISQLLRQLKSQGKLKAIGALSGSEGCVSTIATLVGEIQRAAKSPAEVAEIIASRARDFPPQQTPEPSLHTQAEYDREVSLLYSTYCELLDRFQLTEADADQRRALAVVNGELDGQTFRLPWLAKVELVVLDGFFDFTPVQGEILRWLIPQVPDALVNLNQDQRNREIFLPFQETIDQLQAIAPFDVPPSITDVQPTRGALAGLRERLFNPDRASNLEAGDAVIEEPDTGRQDEIRYLECGDRETEIRAVAKEVKELILRQGYELSDIALVVRQRAAYAETITRVMRDESIPCNLELPVAASDIPANRAVLKLFAILEELAREESMPPRTSELADLIKSEYFRISDADIAALSHRFDEAYAVLFNENDQATDGERLAQLKKRYRIGLWDADALENAVAYVGSELPVALWLKRAGDLIAELPGAAATRELLNIDPVEQARDPDEADQIENAETAKVEERDAERKRRPSRDIHPAALAWTSLVIQDFSQRISAVEHEGTPASLRHSLMKLLDQLSYRQQVTRPALQAVDDEELPTAILNYHSLEALRRSFVAAIKSIEVAGTISPETSTTSLATFIDEVRRCLNSQSITSGSADRSGLRVLEATDMRGLRFRAVFVVGLVEGGFPLRAARDWIYPHEERERLKRYGLTLEDISPATLLKEEHYFYQSVCRATERLFLTRPLTLADDSETVASYYIDELRSAVAPFVVESETVRRDYEGEKLGQVSTPAELDVALVRQQERHFHRGDKSELLPQPRIKSLLALARNDQFLSPAALRRIEIERERGGTGFGPYDGEITDPQLISLLNQRFGADFVHSASGLSTYGNCGYRFFGQRVLKLEPRGEAALDLQAIDAGKLLHDILRRFFERHRRQRLTELDQESLQAELRDLADRVFDEHERVVPPLNKQIWKIDREIRKILLDQVLLYELEMQRSANAWGVVPAYFELAFGGMKSAARDPDSREEPLEISRSTFVGEETIKVSGQIDRVDVANDGTLIAYDYKLSTGSTKDDIKAGRSLQLPIYLEALERLILPNKTIAGGGYYVIRGGNERRNRGLHRAGLVRYSGLNNRAGAVISDDEWQQIRSDVIAKVWNFLDHMRAGHFGVNPSEKDKTCRFCDFSAVCRYERFRIDQKRLSTDAGSSRVAQKSNEGDREAVSEPEAVATGSPFTRKKPRV